MRLGSTTKCARWLRNGHYVTRKRLGRCALYLCHFTYSPSIRARIYNGKRVHLIRGHVISYSDHLNLKWTQNFVFIVFSFLLTTQSCILRELPLDIAAACRLCRFFRKFCERHPSPPPITRLAQFTYSVYALHKFRHLYDIFITRLRYHFQGSNIDLGFIWSWLSLAIL